MKKVVILFTDIFDRGGIQRYNQYLYSALREEFKGHAFSLYLLKRPGNNEYGGFGNVTIKYSPGPRFDFAKKIAYGLRVILECLIKKPDFLICGHVNLAPIAAFLSIVYGVRYVVLTHGTDVWALKKGVRYYGLKKADYILTISEYTKRAMIANGISAERLAILPDAVDTSFFRQKPVDEEIRLRLIPEGKKVLLTVGRMSAAERYKGHDIMLEVMQSLGERYVWLIVGSGDDMCRLTKKASAMGISDRVIFCGPASDDMLVDYYNLCDCFIMPSKGEGFGIVYLEAMACGKPVIAGCGDGSTGPLMDGRLGFSVDPDSVPEIVDAINKATTEREDRTDPSYLRREANRYFGLPAFRERVRGIFNRMLA